MAFTSLLHKKYSICPWITESEFEEVKSLMHSNKLQEWIAARDRLFLWKSRCDNRLHDVFELSLAVLCDLLEFQCEASSLTSSEFSQVTLHSAATTIVRFVSLLTEAVVRDRSDYTTVMQLADKVDIPEWIVDLRHEIVHTKMPARDLIQRGLLFAKQYLCERFWMLEENTVPFDYLSSLKETILQTLDGPPKGAKGSVAVTPQEIICSSRVPCASLFLDLLTDHMIAKEKWTTLITVSTSSKPTVPPPMVQHYQLLLDMIYSLHLLDALVSRLCDRLTAELTASNWIIAAWIDHLVKYYKVNDADKMRTLLFEITTKMSMYTEPLLHRLLSKKIVKEDQKQQILALTKVFNGDERSTRPLEPSKIFSVEDLTVTSPSTHLPAPGSVACKKKESAGIWWRDSDRDWSSVPVGAVLGAFGEPHKHLILPRLECQEINEQRDPFTTAQSQQVKGSAVDFFQLSDRDILDQRITCDYKGMQWSCEDLTSIKTLVQLL